MPPLLHCGGSSWSSLPAFLLETFPALPISPLLMFYLFFEGKHPKLQLGLQRRLFHLGSVRPLIFWGKIGAPPVVPQAWEAVFLLEQQGWDAEVTENSSGCHSVPARHGAARGRQRGLQ